VINKPAPVESGKPISKLADIDSLVSGMKTVMLSSSSSTPVVEDDKMLEDFMEIPDEPKKEIVEKVVDLVEKKVAEPVKKSLAELEIDINSIEPSDEPPRVLLDERKGLKVMLNFAKDRPRDDVLVVVITVINQGAQQVKNFHFDSSVSKPCKLRLLEPSCTELEAVKGWKPPTDLITQVLLLSNPTEKPVSILCILTYCLDDDPDPVKESIEVKDIPFICQ
jgi:ADP-ribosylation factor-binding protein GGA